MGAAYTEDLRVQTRNKMTASRQTSCTLLNFNSILVKFRKLAPVLQGWKASLSNAGGKLAPLTLKNKHRKHTL